MFFLHLISMLKKCIKYLSDFHSSSNNVIRSNPNTHTNASFIHSACFYGGRRYFQSFYDVDHKEVCFRILAYTNLREIKLREYIIEEG